MNITLLKSFHEVVTNKSISKAAKSLHISQPALSIQIKALEDQVGHQLLKRSNRGVEVTESGEIVYNHCQTLITLGDNLLQEIEDIKNSSLYTIKIGSCSSMSQYALPCTIYTFKEEHPNIDLLVQTTSSNQVIEDLLNYSIDIGFIEGRTDHKEIVCNEIMDSRLTLILPPGKYYKGIENISIEEFLELPFIFFAYDDNTINKIEAELIKSNINPKRMNIMYKLDSIESIKSSVANGIGVSVLPYFTVKREVRVGELETKAVRDSSFRNPFSIIYPKTRTFKKEVHHFLEFIDKYGKDTFCFPTSPK